MVLRRQIVKEQKVEAAGFEPACCIASNKHFYVRSH